MNQSVPAACEYHGDEAALLPVTAQLGSNYMLVRTFDPDLISAALCTLAPRVSTLNAEASVIIKVLRQIYSKTLQT